MKKNPNRASIYFTLMLGAVIIIGGYQIVFAAVPGNLIVNPDMQISSPGAPTNWALNGYNDTFTGTYPVNGPLTGDKAARIDTTVHNTGDAKWVFDNIPVSQGNLYAFADSYNSTVPTSLVAAFTTATATPPTLFTTIANLPSSNGVWQTSSASFTVPIGYSLVSVYHVIAAVGSLVTTNYSLSLSAQASNNLFSKGLVSLTFDDGWSTQYDNALPILKNKNLKGTFFIVSQKMLDANTATDDNLLSQTAYPDLLVDAQRCSTSWSNIFTDPTNKNYRFTDFYTSNQTSTVELTYRLNGSFPKTIVLGTLPASPLVLSRATFLFTLPGDPVNAVTPISIAHKTNCGNLTISNPSLANYDLYMNSNQILETQADGNEIGNHTVNHCDLVTGLCPDNVIPNSPDTLTPQQEIGDAKNTLLSYVDASSNSFAYPYGSYNTDVRNLIMGNGITAARSINSGFNTRFSDKLVLSTQVLDSTTPLSRVYEWIDNAVKNNWWLILTFHQVEDQSIINANGDTGAITPATFASIANYLKSSNVVTLNEGLNLMSSNQVTTFTITATAGTNGTMNPSGLTTVNSGSNQTFTITPDTGYSVDVLTIDGTTTTPATTYTFTNVTANHVIGVTFKSAAAVTYSINATAGANGTISPNATSTVVSGSNQTYIITPNSGFEINTLRVDGSAVTSTPSFAFVNVTANHTIEVTFRSASPVSYTITATAGANGTISSSTSVTSGANSTFNINPNPGFNINNLFIDGVTTTPTTTYTFINVITNHTIDVTFSSTPPPLYKITATAGPNGTISPNATSTVVSGANQSYTITPDSGYYIDTVAIDGVATATTSSFTFSNISAYHTIDVTFKAVSVLTYTINATSGANGTVSPSTTVASGESSTFTIIPDTGYAIATLLVDGVATSTATSYTFNNVTANHTISATFSAAPTVAYTIAATAGISGTISPNGTTTLTSGSNQTYTMTPDPGFDISSLTIDGSTSAATSTYTFTNVISNHTIDVSFSAIIATSTPPITNSWTGWGGSSSGGGDSIWNYYSGRESINVPLNISPDQSGRAVLDLGKGRRLTVYVPLYAVKENVRITIKPIQIQSTDGMLNGLPSGTSMIDNTVYEINAINQSGQRVEAFTKDLVITINLDNVQNPTGAAMYYDDPINNRWIMIANGVVNENKQISVNINHLSKFSIIQSPVYARVINYLAPTPLSLGVTGSNPKTYPANTLVRTPNKKIYVVIKGQRVYITNLKQLAKYQGKKIIEISYQDFENIK